jgi:hypothetical protein
MCIPLLEHDIFDEVVIWRLTTIDRPEIVFQVGKAKFFRQKWVKSFEEAFNYHAPTVCFFRGGFQNYCQITKSNPDFFGLKLYLGASFRTTPQYGGIYDKILVESNEHLLSIPNTIPFYKSCNPNIFKPLTPNKNPEFDLCWVSNNTQAKIKGQDFFIDTISKNKYMRKLKIIHIGNKPEIGIEMCKAKGVDNIKFLGYMSRQSINEYLNKSKFGIITSNERDGSPRVSTEVLCSGTPLLLRSSTKLLDYYKENDCVIDFKDDDLINKIREIEYWRTYTDNVIQRIENEDFSIETICQKNIELW